MMKSPMAHLNLIQMKEKLKNKRMKKTDTTEDPKVVFESNWEKKISVAKSRAKKVINMCLIIVR